MSETTSGSSYDPKSILHKFTPEIDVSRDTIEDAGIPNAGFFDPNTSINGYLKTNTEDGKATLPETSEEFFNDIPDFYPSLDFHGIKVEGQYPIARRLVDPSDPNKMTLIFFWGKGKDEVDTLNLPFPLSEDSNLAPFNASRINNTVRETGFESFGYWNSSDGYSAHISRFNNELVPPQYQGWNLNGGGMGILGYNLGSEPSPGTDVIQATIDTYVSLYPQNIEWSFDTSLILTQPPATPEKIGYPDHIGTSTPSSVTFGGALQEAGDVVRDQLLNAYKEASTFDEWGPEVGADLDEQFDGAFSYFLRNEIYQGLEPAGQYDYTNAFLEKWESFLIRIAGYNTANYGPGQSVITSLVQVASDMGFKVSENSEILTAFYEREMANKGFFLPSHALADWVTTAFDDYLKGKDVILVDGIKLSSVSTEQTERVKVLLDIFNLLVLMIQVLQDVAAAQAERLAFLSRWQKAYTDLIAQVRTFGRDDGTRVGYSYGDSEQDSRTASARGDLNQKAMNIREKLSALRSVVGDEAKTVQSRVNQSTDSVNQHVNLITAILTQMTTIFSSIFSG